ncbi:uncharacterized protein LOC113648997 [Tachysurus fulvidraco]|uniref:uncharacterized protein LOC113648997 n=1 Tax=Tachysurus fulvidraco TaxID=1234273 RepID=UPI001FEDB363|nr:uncharacterized protein LOC113648997 [Tachysurus fulvidraco]
MTYMRYGSPRFSDSALLSFSDLATISNMGEMKKLNHTLMKENAKKAWIGLQRAGPGRWLWSLEDQTFYRDRVTYTNWDSGQPNNAGEVEYCVGYNKYNKLWDDNQCETLFPFVCYEVGGAAALFKRFMTRRQGKLAGALVKLRQRGLKTPLPSIHLANLRSLSNKTDQLLLLTRKNKDFSNSAALCFTETWLNDSVPDSALSLPGFQLFRAGCDAE